MAKSLNVLLKEDFERDGYVVVDTRLDEKILDGARKDLEKYYPEDRPLPLRVPYADYNRVQDGWHVSQNVLAIAQCKQVLDILFELYEEPPRPFQTLNFYRGTEQEVHADNIHFNCEPFGLMCGVWVALEDIGEDQGPLIYYPGSQELPEMNYDDFGLEGDYSNYPLYLKELEKIIERKGYQPEFGLINKGQAVIWSANVFHGGSKQANKDLTRHSQVTHYYMGNPKCWRPSFSKNTRAYFEPGWVRNVEDEPYWYPAPDPPPPPPPRPTIKRPVEFAQRAGASIMRRLFGKFV